MLALNLDPKYKYTSSLLLNFISAQHETLCKTSIPLDVTSASQVNYEKLDQLLGYNGVIQAVLGMGMLNNPKP